MNKHIAALAAPLLAGCAAVGPDYVRPALDVPAHYTQADPAGAGAGAAELRQVIHAGAVPAPLWWRSFNSPELDALVDLALKGSPTLESAEATLQQARAEVRAERGASFPQLNIEASAARNGGGGDTANSSAIGPALAFDADVAGARARRIEQAQALARAQQAQWHASRLSLIGNTVLRAIELASANEQLRAAQDILAADQRSLELVRVSAAAGKTAGLDVLTAESQLASDRALVPPLLQQASAARHALAVLAGQNPSAWRVPELDFTKLALPREIPLTLPSQLLRRRPDIAQSEAQLHAASAAIGVAAAQLYPAVTLSASWTRASVGGALFANPANAWRLAADAVAPLFNGGALRARRDAAVYGYAAQLGAYRQTVLLAFAQVADLLQALANDAALLDAQRKAFDAAQATLDLTQQSYQAGQASFPQVIEAQRLFQQARLGYVRANAQRYTDTLQLLVALGGAERL